MNKKDRDEVIEFCKRNGMAILSESRSQLIIALALFDLADAIREKKEGAK